MIKRVLVSLCCAVAVACGSSSSPAAPSTSTLAAPTNFVTASQAVTMTSNVLGFTWSGSSSTYKILIGSTAGASDLVSADVTGTSYTWTAPRTANIYYARVVATSGGQTSSPATEIPVFTIDMRNMIDALFFGFGPMSDAGTNGPASSAAVWVDGAPISVLVTTEAGAASLTAAQTFVADYLAATSNYISVSIDTTPQTYKGVSLAAIPANTVVVRVDNTVCPQVGVIACAFYGPLPYGPGRSTVNLNAAPTGTTPDSWRAIAHEIGHAFGLHHLTQTTSARAEFRFLMNPTLVADQLTTAEKTAIAAARAGGIRPGWTRAQAVAAGLVLANPGASIAPLISLGRMNGDDLVWQPAGVR